MSDIIHAQGVHKCYGRKSVLNDINLNVNKGELIGLVGPNGAGKTTLLKAILGLTPVEGQLEVLGMNPKKQRDELMQRVSFIADTAILPPWIRVQDAMDFIARIHPRFNRELALKYLENTNIPLRSKVRELSKGMVTKAHLSLIMAIDSDLLILDEPTLGLDIIKRKEFYQQLLGDYFDGDKTIIITTHQVEEIENLLTRAIFINDGDIVLDEKVEAIQERYFEVLVENEHQQKADALNPIYVSKGLQGNNYMFESKNPDNLQPLGKVSQPSLADIFVAKVSA